MIEEQAKRLALAFTLPADPHCPTDVINSNLTEEELLEKRENLTKIFMKYNDEEVQS